MTTEKTSQAQHPFQGFPGFELWTNAMSAHNERFEKTLAEMERLERERHERTVAAIDHVSALMKSTLEYQSELAAAWRKLGIEAQKSG